MSKMSPVGKGLVCPHLQHDRPSSSRVGREVQEVMRDPAQVGVARAGGSGDDEYSYHPLA
jgi:hypothetical protein